MKIKGFLGGLLLMIFAAFIILDTTDVINLKEMLNFEFFIRDIWSFLLIVLCVIGVVFSKEKFYNAIGIVVGFCLLIYNFNLISLKTLLTIFAPLILVVVGLKLVICSVFPNKANKIIRIMKEDGVFPETCRGILFNRGINYEDGEFNNADICGVFANAACDLHDAIVEGDRAIKALALFGNVDIYVPNNVDVVVRSNSIFGAVLNGTSLKNSNVTIHISCTCIFGRVKIESPNTDFDGPWVL